MKIDNPSYIEIPKNTKKYQKNSACRRYSDILYKYNENNFFIRHIFYEVGAQIENYFLFFINGKKFFVHNYWTQETELFLPKQFLEEQNLQIETIQEHIEQGPPCVQHVIVKIQ